MAVQRRKGDKLTASTMNNVFKLPDTAQGLTVAIYARVSTDDKDQNPETQLMPLREYCQRQNWGVFEEFVDFVPAGDHARRYRWNCLLLEASWKHFDVILVYRLDRAFRTMLDGVNTLERLRGWGVGFRSYSEPYIDTTTPMGELMFHISAAWAQLERGILAERVTAGMARAKAQGIHVGRPRVIDQVDVDLVIDLRSTGTAWRRVAKMHPLITVASGKRKRPSVATLRRVMEGGQGDDADEE